MESSPSPPSPSAASPPAAPAANGAAVSTSNGGGGGGNGVGEPGKLFVGGIPWDATEDALRDYFGKYGDVTEAIIMRERGTGNARGFGFVSFSDPSAADKAIQDTAAKHAILGRPVEVKRAIPRGEQHQNHQHQFSDHHHQHHGKPSSKSGGGRAAAATGDSGQAKTKKIFVGGLSANVTQEEFRGYFEKFGKITDVVVMYDSATHRPRGFGFITFESEESADGAVETTFQTLNGKTVEVKKAIPRDGGGGAGVGGGDGGGGGKNGFYYGRSAQSPRTAGNGRGAILDGYGGGGMYPPYGHRLGGGFQGYGAAAAPPYSPYGYAAAGAGEGYGFGGYGVGYGAPPFAGPGELGTAQDTSSAAGGARCRTVPPPASSRGTFPALPPGRTSASEAADTTDFPPRETESGLKPTAAAAAAITR
ncbi:unnamed protein product [Spirodela intermedia]|uniref:RRM domain-containing protein n=1 Tax=Spirodela intermedia TaxID=51605 RepID=A0A7I8IYE2_SPIIN|nr:unnamed protein product [Spirodela intermedia]CAA6663026.1 unnamed protein product [Spirodela intermedia]